MRKLLSLKKTQIIALAVLAAAAILVTLPAGAEDSSQAVITEADQQQANQELDQLLTEGGVETDLFGFLLSFLESWLDVPRVKTAAVLLEPWLPRYYGNVPVADSDRIYDWVEGLCAWPHRRPGSPEGLAAEDWIADQFESFGLEDVTKQPIDINVWEADSWSLDVEGEEIPSFQMVNAGLTEEEGVTAPLAYVGLGLPSDFNRVDVQDKIAVVEIINPYLPTGACLAIPNSHYFLSDPENSINLFTGQFLNFMYLNIWARPTWEAGELPDDEPIFWDVYDLAAKHGAKGVALILANKPSKHNTQWGIYDGNLRPIPAVWVGKYDAFRLRRLAWEGKEATLTLTGSIEPGQMNNVYGILPGTTDDTLIICSHHDSPFKGPVEDGTGISQVMAQAWAWSQVPKYKRKKTLVFVAAAGHLYGGWGGYTFAYENPDIMEDTWLVLNLEHIAAKEVKEWCGEYKETGEVAVSVLWTSENAKVLATAMRSLRKKPSKRVVSLPATMFGIPFSDAPGYLGGARANGIEEPHVLSWITCPYYLLDDQDTFDMVDKDELGSVAESVTEIIKNFMAMRYEP